jgi:hypothetical protein
VQLVCDLTENLLAQPTPLRVDSCAAPGHPMIDHVWRERLGLADRLVRLGPQQGLAFSRACRLERARRAAIAGLKRARDVVRGRS